MTSSVALLLLFASLAATFLVPVNAKIDYQLVIYAVNAPSGALDKISSNSTFFGLQVLSVLPGYQLIAPGQIGRRELATKDETEDEEDMPPQDEIMSSLRGGQSQQKRELLSTCPTYCQTTRTAKCRNMGCYSTGRRRRLQLFANVLSCTDALLKETLINTELIPYCQLNLFCSITSKIMKVGTNGTIVPVC